MKKIVAKATKTREFMYSGSSAHVVSARSAKKILTILNTLQYHLKDDEVWHIYNVDKYDYAYYTEKRFSIYKGVVREHC